MPKFIVRQVTEFAVEAPNEFDAAVFAELNMGLGKKICAADTVQVEDFPAILEPHKFDLDG